MSNDSEEYIKKLEAHNAKLLDLNETLISSYGVMEKFFVISSYTNLEGTKEYAITVKASTSKLSEKEYNALVLLGIETDPHVDMHIEPPLTEEEDLHIKKIIDEAWEDIKKYQP